MPGAKRFGRARRNLPWEGGVIVSVRRHFVAAPARRPLRFHATVPVAVPYRPGFAACCSLPAAMQAW